MRLIFAILFSFWCAFAQAQNSPLCYTSNGINCAKAVQASNSVAINISSATTTQLVALAANQTIYVTSFDVVTGGTGTIQFEYGTGTTCGTGTTILTGAYNLIVNSILTKGNGLGPILIVPPGNALCAVTVGAVQYSGSLSYAQFQN
jgi:hypothetical protein